MFIFRVYPVCLYFALLLHTLFKSYLNDIDFSLLFSSSATKKVFKWTNCWGKYASRKERNKTVYSVRSQTMGLSPKGVTRKHLEWSVMLQRFWATTQILSWTFVASAQEVIWADCADSLKCAILPLHWICYRFYSLEVMLSNQHYCSKTHYHVLGTGLVRN